MEIRIAQTDAEIDACYPVMSQLRPHVPRAGFVERIRGQEVQGYRLAFVWDENRVVAVAGFRLSESLACGRHMYVDDLVTAETGRSRGFGQRLLEWLVEYARSQGCVELHLDSGVQRFDAHRFYLRNRMRIASHHFSLSLSPPKP